MGEFFSFLQNNLADFWTYTGFHNATTGAPCDDSDRYILHLSGRSEGI